MIGHGLKNLARAALLLCVFAMVASCGSGSVGAPPVNDPTTITILPGNATLYSGLPTTFSITGGTGAYIVSSSNQAVVQVATTTLVGNTLTVIPNPVLTDTALTLTARDTGTTTPVSVNLTVKPGTVSNTITVSPGASACAPAICSGGDAVISTVIAQGGIPLPARGVRFDVVSGDYRFITSPAGVPETTALTVTTITDETGTARARIRALDTAANQSAILQITDLGSGAFQRTSLLLALASATSTGFFVVPERITFTGSNASRCASNDVSSQVFLFGGTPPYTVSNPAPAAFDVSTAVVGSNGGSFTVVPRGGCTTGIPIAVRDAAGRLLTVTLVNQLGTNLGGALAVAPSALTLNSCTAVASVIAVGGQSGGVYRATPNSDVVVVSGSGGDTFTVQRRPGSNATGVTGIVLAVTDGATVVSVPITLTAPGNVACP